MNKLQISIKNKLDYYKNDLMDQRHWSPKDSIDIMNEKKGFKPYVSAYCDIDKDGNVTQIRFYHIGDTINRNDYSGKSCNITKCINKYLHYDYEWNELIQCIADKVKQKINNCLDT